MSGDVKLEPCPFCGGPADIEEIAPKDAGGRNVSFSAGCRNMDGPDECIGQQSLLTFARKSDAAKAWNRRSSSAAERAVVEALEMAEGTLLIASRMLTEDHKMVLNGKRWGDKTIKAVNAALSSVRGEGGDKQARPSGSAPISTDTKGTTK